MLAFLNIFVESPHLDYVVQNLSTLDNLELLWEVSGESDIFTLVSASNIEELRDTLRNKIMKMKGVKRAVSSVVLKAHRGPSGNNGAVQTQPSANDPSGSSLTVAIE